MSIPAPGPDLPSTPRFPWVVDAVAPAAQAAVAATRREEFLPEPPASRLRALFVWGVGVANMGVEGAEFPAALGQALVALARRVICQRLGRPVADDAGGKEMAASLADPLLQEHRGTFVTLTIDGQLRGCIGSLSAAESILEGVRLNAINAAFGDPRFVPLAGEELAEIAIEVSILSDPQPLSYSGGDDLVAKLRPHVDGVILGRGAARATFLPQVWEQLPQPESFLNHLCLKAMLPMDAWRRGGLMVQTYTVQYFHERANG